PGGPAARAGSQEAPGHRIRHPALPRRQGLLCVPPDAAAVHYARPAGKRLQAPRRVLPRLPAHVHLAGAIAGEDGGRMRPYILRRLALAIPTLVLVSVIVFSLMRFMPGDVVTRMVEGQAYAPTVEALRKELGLDRPASVQYAEWISGILLRGDFGNS